MSSAPVIAVPPWYEVALREVGEKEISGTEDNPRIVEYLGTTTLPSAQHDEVPWCSAFVNWCFAQVGIAGTRRANARSWLTWGRELRSPRTGCVVVLWRKHPALDTGHVAFYSASTERSLRLLGGNQRNSVCDAYYPAYRVLGFRWPTI